MWVLPAFNDAEDSKVKCKTVRDSSTAVVNQKLWIDENPPQTIHDLSVHKKKISELNNWIDDSINGIKGKKLLLLTGPPGSGKTAAVKILAKEQNIDIREWTNQLRTEKYADDELWINQADQFSHFLSKASKYNNIFMVQSVDEEYIPKKSLILVKELPLSFIKNPVEFHQVLRKYNSCAVCPVIFIMSDAGDNKGDLRFLFSAEIQDELSMVNIVFNSVASSILLQAMNRILQLRINNNKLTGESLPSKQFLQSVIEKSGGDIRSAINILQFTLTKEKTTDQYDRKGKSRRKRQRKESTDDVDVIGCKDTKLILFRALGKVLYCKRKNERDPEHILPPHLRNEDRMLLEENPEDIFERSMTEASTFSLFLHHNCPTFFSDISVLQKSLNCVTDADILQSYWNPYGILDDYCASLSIRGMMHNVSAGEQSSSSSSKTFRPLTSPSYFSCVRTVRDRLHKMKHICRMVSYSDEELTTTVIPFVAKICQSSSNEVDRFIREVGLLYPPSQGGSWNLKNTNHSGTDNNSTVLQYLSNEPPCEDDLQEDFLVEEFDE